MPITKVGSNLVKEGARWNELFRNLGDDALKDISKMQSAVAKKRK